LQGHSTAHQRVCHGFGRKAPTGSQRCSGTSLRPNSNEDKVQGECVTSDQHSTERHRKLAQWFIEFERACKALDSALDNRKRIPELGQIARRKYSELREEYSRRNHDKLARDWGPMPRLTDIPEQDEIEQIHSSYVEALNAYASILGRLRSSLPVGKEGSSRELIEELKAHGQTMSREELIYAVKTVIQHLARSTAQKQKPGRRGIPYNLKEQALEMKQQGETNRTCAKVLYKTNYPTPSQITSVPTVLRHYQKSAASKN
jgi:hypothetical protein